MTQLYPVPQDLLAGLTPSRLVQTDADNALISVSNLASWIAGTTNRVTVTDDADGTITLSGPQDLHTGASPEFYGLTLNHLQVTANMTVGDGIGGPVNIGAQTSTTTDGSGLFVNAGETQFAGGVGGTLTLCGGASTNGGRGGNVFLERGIGTPYGDIIVGSFSGLLKGTSGVVSAATAGTDYQSGTLTATRIPYATGTPGTLTDAATLTFDGTNVIGTGYSQFGNGFKTGNGSLVNTTLNLKQGRLVADGNGTYCELPLGTEYRYLWMSYPVTSHSATPPGASFQIYGNTSSFPGQMYFDSGSHNSAFISFRTGITSEPITERFRIGANGDCYFVKNLRIGSTVTPTVNLDVTGQITANNIVTGTYFQTSTAITANSTGTVVLIAKDAGVATANAEWLPIKNASGVVRYIPIWA
jgi:hypothetical protein